ncbi:hypothetical protein HZB01_03160 [Candidatus Woesearchaeota archaeon]|nr:hypothetical protein [Candidatus Woesearchaeota archaeon]
MHESHKKTIKAMLFFLGIFLLIFLLAFVSFRKNVSLLQTGLSPALENGLIMLLSVGGLIKAVVEIVGHKHL